MKHKSTYKSFLLLLLLASCRHKGPIISYDEKIINLGNITFNQKYTSKIIIRNRGDMDLKLLNANPDCSCTITNVPKDPIKPGDSALLHLQITPAVDGYIQQSVYLDNNSSNENRVLFLIRANVKLLK
ncbi:MAG: DUF1573 domain-containing protein [Sediminibacterium magnilacihabitans]|nr:DUF1573 domain-containing protein [Sediminibacterium magnilacihabitans]PQV58019.1 uncharacterized protein DUF1573 [Sediminibacterium magnilacihabitans]